MGIQKYETTKRTNVQENQNDQTKADALKAEITSKET